MKPNDPDIWYKKPVASVKCPICEIDEKYSCDCRCHDEKKKPIADGEECGE